MEWRLSGSVDGTHNVSNNQYKLIVFGVTYIDKNGTRNFYPICLAFGEGETQIVTLILILYMQIALLKLFGVAMVHFKAGIVFDRTFVWSKPFGMMFPLTQLMTCFTVRENIIVPLLYWSWNDLKMQAQ